ADRFGDTVLALTRGGVGWDRAGVLGKGGTGRRTEDGLQEGEVEVWMVGPRRPRRQAKDDGSGSSSSVRRASSDELSLLTVENRHLRFRVTRAGDSARGHRGLESGDLRRVKGDIETRQCVHELFARASTDGRDDRHVLSRALRPYPCDGKLRGG